MGSVLAEWLMQDTFITMGTLPPAKFGTNYRVNPSAVGMRGIGSVVPVWSASGAVTTVPVNPPGTVATIPIPSDASSGSQFQLTVTAILPGTPSITVSETQSINIFP